MKKQFSVEQIVAVMKQAEAGVPVAELIRKVGISEQTFYRWKKQYVGMELAGATDEAAAGRKQPVEAAGSGVEPGQDDVAGCAAKKVLRPSSRRPMVDHLRDRYRASERHACRNPSDGARHISLQLGMANQAPDIRRCRRISILDNSRNLLWLLSRTQSSSTRSHRSAPLRIKHSCEQ
jgi:transposase-like protein